MAQTNGAAPEVDRTPPNCESCGAQPQVVALIAMQVDVGNPIAGPNGQAIMPRIDGASIFRPPLLCPDCRRALIEVIRGVRELVPASEDGDGGIRQC